MGRVLIVCCLWLVGKNTLAVSEYVYCFSIQFIIYFDHFQCKNHEVVSKFSKIIVNLETQLLKIIIASTASRKSKVKSHSCLYIKACACLKW